MEKIIKILVSIMNLLAPQLKKEDSKEDVNEIIDVIIAFNETSIKLCSLFKDGVQFKDFTEFYKHVKDNEEYREIMREAYENYQKIPAQAKDADAGEIVQMSAVQVSYVPKYVEALKK